METEKFRSKLSISIPSSRSYRIYVSRYFDFSSILRNEIYKNDNKIVEIFVHAISRSPSIPRFFFLEKLSRELSICLRRIFANLRSVLIRGNRLPVKVISSDDGKTDFSSNWHHSRRGGTLAFDWRRIGMQPAQPVLPVAAYAASAAKDASSLVTRGTSTPCATKSDGGRPCSGLKSSRHATLGFVVLTKRAHAR